MKIKGTQETVYVQKEVALDASDVESAKANKDLWLGDYEVLIAFTPAGQKKVQRVTENNVGKRLGIVVGGELLSAPIIRAPILGDAVIAGRISEREANELVEKINAAAGHSRQ